MKNTIALMISILLATSVGFANESLGENAKATGNDIKRSAKKGWNRTKEAVCMEGDLKCAAKKVKNRTGEGVETVQDKTKEAVNSVDSNSNN